MEKGLAWRRATFDSRRLQGTTMNQPGAIRPDPSAWVGVRTVSRSDSQTELGPVASLLRCALMRKDTRSWVACQQRKLERNRTSSKKRATVVGQVSKEGEASERWRSLLLTRKVGWSVDARLFESMRNV